MRRASQTEDKGPMFFLVHETDHGTWDSRAYWSVEAANRRAAKIKANGYKAFVEAR